VSASQNDEALPDPSIKQGLGFHLYVNSQVSHVPTWPMITESWATRPYLPYPYPPGDKAPPPPWHGKNHF